MGDMGLKQKALVAILGVIALYAFAVVWWFISAEAAWKKAAKSYDRAKDAYAKELRLIGEKRKWATEYDSEKVAMPMFAIGEATDTTWWSKVDEVASANLVQIGQRNTQKEVEAGDVLELPLEGTWEGSLEALVKFMHALENSDAGMFDVKKLNFKPSSRRGYLRGSFTVACAYMRGDKRDEAPRGRAATAEGANEEENKTE